MWTLRFTGDVNAVETAHVFDETTHIPRELTLARPTVYTLNAYGLERNREELKATLRRRTRDVLQAFVNAWRLSHDGTPLNR